MRWNGIVVRRLVFYRYDKLDELFHHQAQEY